MKFTEVNKFATITNHMLTECPVIVNKKFWGSPHAWAAKDIQEGSRHTGEGK